MSNIKLKNLFVLVFIICSYKFSSAQGLEKITVEKYYITDKFDSRCNESDKLPINSVTYRVFIDMKQGYKLQSVFGAPGHELKLSTSTYFYNHSLYGSNIPNLIADDNLKYNTVMLDSWIGVGGGSQQNYAVLKAEDDSLNTIKNSCVPPILQSINDIAGVPVKTKDGLAKLADLPPRLTQVGLDSLLLSLDKVSTPGSGFSFVTSNGGWGCLGGAMGADSSSNKVCIGQFTTNGDFYFEFNIQIGSPEFGVEQYVARNPEKSERFNQDLIISIPAISKRN